MTNSLAMKRGWMSRNCRRLVAWAIILAIPAMAAQATASPVTVMFSGQLTSVLDFDDVLDPSIVAGGVFSGSYSFDPAEAVDVNPDPERGTFEFDSTFSVEMGDLVFEAPTLTIGMVLNPASYLGQGYGVYSRSFSSAGLFVEYMSMSLCTYRTDLFDGEAPPEQLDLDDFASADFVFSAQYITIRGVVTDLVVVPEPSTGALMLCACAAAFARCRKPRRAVRYGPSTAAQRGTWTATQTQ